MSFGGCVISSANFIGILVKSNSISKFTGLTFNFFMLDEISCVFDVGIYFLSE